MAEIAEVPQPIINKATEVPIKEVKVPRAQSLHQMAEIHAVSPKPKDGGSKADLPVESTVSINTSQSSGRDWVADMTERDFDKLSDKDAVKIIDESLRQSIGDIFESPKEGEKGMPAAKSPKESDSAVSDTEVPTLDEAAKVKPYMQGIIEQVIGEDVYRDVLSAEFKQNIHLLASLKKGDAFLERLKPVIVGLAKGEAAGKKIGVLKPQEKEFFKKFAAKLQQKNISAEDVYNEYSGYMKVNEDMTPAEKAESLQALEDVKNAVNEGDRKEKSEKFLTKAKKLGMWVLMALSLGLYKVATESGQQQQ